MTARELTSPQNVLLAMDGSEHALAAAKLLRDLPIPKTCKITALTIMIPRHAQYHEILTSVLEKTRAIFHAADQEIETKLIAGHPAEKIVEYAEETQPNLIVIGARGLRATLGILLGGVAQQVVEYACCPVLVVRSPYNSIRRVLLVTDGSAHSVMATEHLRVCPLPENAIVEVIHVLPPPVTPDMLIRAWPVGMDVIPPIPSPDIEEKLAQQSAIEEKQGYEILEKASKTLHAYGIEAKTILRCGDAATEILDYAKENEVDLIITGSRGLSLMQSWLLGSVSRKLVHYAPCSVLIVKGRPEALPEPEDSNR
jgi:nucleotide-binding universal stress UspA family protein